MKSLEELFSVLPGSPISCTRNAKSAHLGAVAIEHIRTVLDFNYVPYTFSERLKRIESSVLYAPLTIDHLRSVVDACDHGFVTSAVRRLIPESGMLTFDGDLCRIDEQVYIPALRIGNNKIWPWLISFKERPAPLTAAAMVKMVC